MQMTTHEVAEKVKALPDMEKLALVDQILIQLDRPDPEIDKAWAAESQKRWQAYREGHADSIPYADVMAKYRRP